MKQGWQELYFKVTYLLGLEKYKQQKQGTSYEGLNFPGQFSVHQIIRLSVELNSMREKSFDAKNI